MLDGFMCVLRIEPKHYCFHNEIDCLTGWLNWKWSAWTFSLKLEMETVKWLEYWYYVFKLILRIWIQTNKEVIIFFAVLHVTIWFAWSQKITCSLLAKKSLTILQTFDHLLSPCIDRYGRGFHLLGVYIDDGDNK